MSKATPLSAWYPQNRKSMRMTFCKLAHERPAIRYTTLQDSTRAGIPLKAASLYRTGQDVVGLERLSAARADPQPCNHAHPGLQFRSPALVQPQPSAAANFRGPRNHACRHPLASPISSTRQRERRKEKLRYAQSRQETRCTICIPHSTTRDETPRPATS